MSFAFQFQIEPEEEGNGDEPYSTGGISSSSSSDSGTRNTTVSNEKGVIETKENEHDRYAIQNIRIAQLLDNWTVHSSVPEILPLSGPLSSTVELYQIVVPGKTVQEATREVDRCSGGVTWECTYDLLHYLRTQQQQPEEVSSSVAVAASLSSSSSSSTSLPHPLLTNRTIMDLGCGSGLLGCYALLSKPLHVIYHDHNPQVLHDVTAANIAINLPILPYTKDTVQNTCTFVSGSWEKLRDTLLLLPSSSTETAAKTLIPHSIDVLLSSETLYRTDSYPILCDLLNILLKPGTGRAYFATKRYYYGIGGGSVPFMKMIETKYPKLHIQCIHTIEDGKSMVREILEVRCTE